MKRVAARLRGGGRRIARAWTIGFGWMLGLAPLSIPNGGAQATTGQPFYRVAGSVVPGGVGQSIGGSFALDAWVGGPSSGTLRGGSYVLEGGCRVAGSDGSNSDAPRLTIALAEGMVLLAWESAGAGFVLESTTALTSAPWVPLVVEPVPAPAGYVIRLPIHPEQRFYRLRK